MAAEHAAGTGGDFFFSGRIHMQFHMNMTPERIRSSYDEMVDMGMKALVEEAAANSWGVYEGRKGPATWAGTIST